jgi:hypothetical protein
LENLKAGKYLLALKDLNNNKFDPKKKERLDLSNILPPMIQFMN